MGEMGGGRKGEEGWGRKGEGGWGRKGDLRWGRQGDLGGCFLVPECVCVWVHGCVRGCVPKWINGRFKNV